MFPILTVSPKRSKLSKKPSKKPQSARSFQTPIPAATTRSSSARNSIDFTNAAPWHDQPIQSIFNPSPRNNNQTNNQQHHHQSGTVKLTAESLAAHNQLLGRADYPLYSITIDKSRQMNNSSTHSYHQLYAGCPARPSTPSVHDVHSDRTRRTKSSRRSKKSRESQGQQRDDPQWLIMLLDSLLAQSIV